MAGNPITKIIITAKDEASAVFTSIQAKVAGVAAAISGYFGIKMFGGALGSAMDFEAAMSRVQAASGASGVELEKLKQAAEQAGATTKYTSTQAAEALENLAKSGLTAEQAVEALPAVLQLAQAGGVELGTAAEYVTKAVNGMGLSFGEAGRVADVLAMGANASNTSVQGLAQALSFAAPLANSLGLSLEDTVAIIGKFADAGIDAGRAGTALNSILAQFSDPASKFRNELANIGITTSDFNKALRQLAASGPAGSKAINAVGQEAGPALRALLNQGIGALDDLTGKLQTAAGSAAEVAATMGGNLTGAVSGFSSAWDAVRRALVAPLLEPLAEQINALSARFRAAVSDGTVGKFGEAIRIAFESAAKWVQHFIDKVDFSEVSARLQEFATRTGEAFSAIGQHATTAGGVLQTAYGVMSAGVNTVLAALYKAGQGMSWLTSAFLADLAKIAAGIDRVTPDAITEKFKLAAQELQLQAQAAYAVSEEFGKRSTEAFAGAAAGAETAANGWKALTESAQASAPEVVKAADAIGGVHQQAELTADQLDALGENAEYAAGSVTKTGKAAAAASPMLKGLGSDAKVAVEQLQAAFDRLGVTSQAALKQTADNAKRDFEIIRNSGQASTRDLSNAFSAYAEKAIAANNGIASATLKAQAAQYQLKIDADAAGKSVVRSMTDAANSVEKVGDAVDKTASGDFGGLSSAAANSGRAVSASMNTAASATDKVAEAAALASKNFWDMSEAARSAETEAQRLSRWDEEGKAARQTRAVGGRDPFAEAMKRGLIEDPSVGLEFREAFNEFFNQSLAKMRPTSNSDYFKKLDFAESDALRKAAEKVTTDKQQEEKTGVRTNRYEVNLRLGGLSRTVNVASASDAQNLTSFLEQLEREAMRAS
ncbi:phage tail tape measure protein [Aromatoleum toluclasticum]|uniref:phage tail tape measure protein n=1 Tax=Aromatoleum toluclasticum TaxID=92003 RepID=UPI00035FD79A|nr:phage tail tape measure protein [Aromatoleum toluclasticum]